MMENRFQVDSRLSQSDMRQTTVLKQIESLGHRSQSNMNNFSRIGAGLGRDETPWRRKRKLEMQSTSKTDGLGI
jgi:hypothetical protein